MSGRKYEYPSDAEFEAAWIETHRRHMVHQSGTWLVCRTCASPINLRTQRASEVMREFNR